MKKLNNSFFPFLILLSFSIGVYSQEDIRSVFDNKNNKKNTWGFYFGPEIKYSKVISINAVYGGIKCAILLNRHFATGLAVGTFLTETSFGGIGSDTTFVGLNSAIAYGGFYLDYITNFSNSPVQISFPTLLGGGGFLLFEKLPPNQKIGGIQDEKLVEGSVYVVIEPSVNIEINLLKKLRMGIGAGYRFVTHSELERYTDSDLSAYTFNLNFKYGIF